MAKQKYIFYGRLLTSIPMAHLKRHYYPNIGKIGRLTMNLLMHNEYWLTAQQCAETRIARVGCFVRSHPTNGLDNFRAKLRAFWKERGLIFLIINDSLRHVDFQRQ